METIKSTSQDTNLLLIGNKCDMCSSRVIPFSEGQALADLHNIPFFETSAYQKVNVDECFQKLAEIVVVKWQGQESMGIEVEQG
jgi:GTPase SAR1 family protein